MHLELLQQNHSGLSFRLVFFLYIFYIWAMTKHQKTKKKSHHALWQLGASIKYVTSKLSLSHSSFKWRHMWKEDESMWGGCSVQSYKHKCNLPLQTWLSEKSQKQKVWRCCQTIFPDSVNVQKNDSLLYLREGCEFRLKCAIFAIPVVPKRTAVFVQNNIISTRFRNVYVWNALEN